MANDESKSKEFEFVRPPYSWEWQMTDIVPHDEKPPILLIRNRENVESHDFTLSFLIERLGLDERDFVADSENESEMDGVYREKRMYTAQLMLKQLAGKDFVLSDRVFKPKDSGVLHDSYGFPYMGATTTIGTEGHFLSFSWEKQLYETFFPMSFHNLERDLVRQDGHGEGCGDSDPFGEKYLGCLEKAIELGKVRKLPPLALIILRDGVSDTLTGQGRWTPAIFRELRYAGFSPNETYGLQGINLSLDIEKIHRLKEAYSRLTTIESTLREMLK